MEKNDFCRRLTQLRMNRGVSARDMSLSIGQSPNYINGIESGGNYPSMAMFFIICEYLEVEPSDFFDTKTGNPGKAGELLKEACSLPDGQLDLLISLTKELKR